MSEAENELWRLGVPAKTRHNEVAPAQFELAPIFEDLNLAVDHNMLTMEILRQTADRHGLVCLLHEKPFAGVNGSGKHTNWALSYGGRNLLDPGDDPRQNAIFLTVLAGVIKAVDSYSDLLRMTVAGAGNDHRLGANEAPPAIISIYLGRELTGILEQLGQGQDFSPVGGDSFSQVGVDLLPPLPKDSTDRNRTSPFAFTGQKFEFRAPGSSQSCAGPMTVLNTIVAEAFNELADKLENLDDFNAGLEKVLAETVQAHRRIIFNGDGYSDEWRQEALARGLNDAPDTMSALAALKEEKNLALLEKYGVYSRRELESRYEIFMEEYHRRVRIEGELSLEMARTMIKPAAVEYYALLAETRRAAGQGGVAAGLEALGHDLDDLGNLLDELDHGCRNLTEALPGLHEGIIEASAGLRAVVDRLEGLIPDQSWPLPKYREMLFIY